MKKIVVFASGSGSNFEAIVKQLHGKVCEVALLICDKPGAGCLERASQLGIDMWVTIPKDYASKVDYERKIIEKLSQINPQLIVLAGYMRIVGPTLLEHYDGKIINIHPSLLPAFAGKDGIKDALAYGVKLIGVTVHFVDAGIDTGKIIDQDGFKIEAHQSVQEIEEKIHAIEHQLYPKVIEFLLHSGDR